MKIINLIFLISTFFTFSSLSNETTSWELLKEGGKVVFIRHAYAPEVVIQIILNYTIVQRKEI